MPADRRGTRRRNNQVVPVQACDPLGAAGATLVKS